MLASHRSTLEEEKLRFAAISISRANAALFAIGMLDLSTTLFWLYSGQITEVNPVMAAVLKMGLSAFVMVKLLTLAAYVGVMEWYRRYRNPAIARIISRGTVLAYLGIYSVSFACVNYHHFLG